MLRVCDVCWEKQRDAKSYFAFVVGTFSELVHTKIPRSRNSCVTTLGSQRARRIRENSSTRNSQSFFSFSNKHQVLSSRRDSVNNFDCRAFSRHLNIGNMHENTLISLGPCGKLGSTKWGVQELEVDNIVFDQG